MANVRRGVCVIFVTCLVAQVCAVFIPRASDRLLLNLRPLPQPTEPCGDVEGVLVCQCHGNMADCTGRVRSDFLPVFKQNITVLLSGGNVLDKIYKNFFENVTELVTLDFHENSLRVVEEGAFSALRKLKILDISGNSNYNHFGVITIAMAIPTLEKLDVSASPTVHNQGRIVSMPTELFRTHPRSQLTTLYMNDFNLGSLDMKMFTYLPQLRELSVSGASVREIRPDYLPALEKLNLSRNSLTRFFPTCPTVRQERMIRSRFFYPNLVDLDLDTNGMSIIFTNDHGNAKTCLPKLQHLTLQNNAIRGLSYWSFHTTERFPSLVSLNLRHAGTAFPINWHAFDNRNLRTLNLSQNSIQFASSKVDAKLFGGCANLTELNLEGNDFTHINESKFQSLFQPLESLQILNLGRSQLGVVGRWLSLSLRNLRELYLHQNQIPAIPEDTFEGMKNLAVLRLDGNLILEIPSAAFRETPGLTTIRMDSNKLLGIPDGAFDDLDLLMTLRLDRNRIQTISERTFNTHTRNRLRLLDLSQNAFECACSLLWFKKWLSDRPRLFYRGRPNSGYECDNKPGTDLTDFFLHEQQCMLSHDAFIAIVVVTFLLIAALTLTSVIYRHRWHIRLVMYEAFRGNPQSRWRQRRPEDFRYDLFVSYDSLDASWVHDHLMPELEGGNGLRLCVHQRDFIPGKNIVDNILESLEVSRRVLCVFSPNFAESQWCHFELEMCLSHVIDNNDVMVIVILQHVPSRDMSGAMLALMNTTTYIEWADDPDVRASFWRRMTLALNDILPRG